jgi:hypothetical protein
MSQKLNNHYVPRFHLKLFAAGKSYLSLASRDGKHIVPVASLKKQCARHKFYGNEIIENWLSTLESRHAVAYREAIRIAWDQSGQSLPEIDDSLIRQAVLLQRCRTPRAARINTGALDKMMLSVYREHLLRLPRTIESQIVIDAIERGRAKLLDSEFHSLITSMINGLLAVEAITDLQVAILRNHTSFPFLMGDSPCVFVNHYLRAVKGFGVLGLFSKGLIIGLPLDSRTQLLFFDPAVYKPTQMDGCCIDVIERGDVSRLNAWQLHSAEQNVYFCDVSAQAYIMELLDAHQSLLCYHESQFYKHPIGSILVDGKPNSREVVHILEPPLPVTADLTFLKALPASLDVHPFEPRNADLAKRVQGRTAKPGHDQPLPIEQMAKWLEGNIKIDAA